MMAQAAQEQKRKKKALGHGIQPFFAIEGGSSEEQVDRIADCAFEVVPGQSKIVLQVPDDWLYGATAAEIFSGFAFVVLRDVWTWGLG